MKILEVREGFIKFESDSQISLSSFIQVSGETKCYVAQVVQVKRAGDYNIAFAKILFLYDGTLQPYDKTLPNKDCKISEFTFEIINKTLDSTEPIVVGKFIDNNINIPMDKTCFNKKLLISSDDSKSLTVILSNLEKQIENINNVVIIDMLGNLDFKKTIAGVDFKLPLNTESLEFMYEDCLNDATSDSKSMIKDIFQDLSEYSKTVPFLPFNTLKTIVDDMVDKSHIFKLLVLKNKLAKFDKQGYFAGNACEAENLQSILNSNISIIDLSKLDTVFQNRYLEVIYSQLEKSDKATQVFVNISNSINKKNLKNLITNENIATTVVTHSKFKYINEIKTMFDNFIIEPSFSNNEIFKVYSTFLNAMQKATCLIVGEGTNYIPLVSTITEFSIEQAPTKQIEQPVSEVEIPEQQIEETTEERELVIDLTESKDDTEIKEATQEIIEDNPIETIDKKSEELIERISEEVETGKTTFNNIFTSDDEENIEVTQQIENSEIEAVSLAQDNELDSLESSEQLDEIIQDNEKQTEEFTIELEDTSISETQVVNLEELESQAQDSVEYEPILGTIEENNNENNTQNIISENVLQEIMEEEQANVIIEEPSLEEISEPESLHSEILPESFSEIESFEEEEEVIELDSDMSELTEDTEEFELTTEENTESFINELTNDTALEKQEIEIVPLSKDSNNFDDIGEFVELDSSDFSDDDIIVEIEPEGDSLLTDEEQLDKEIVEDVDKVFTTMKENSISDTDLDFIDELNEETIIEETLTIEELDPIDNSGSIEELPEFSPDSESDNSDDSFLETLPEVNDRYDDTNSDKEILETRKASTPMVPIYDADIPQEDIVSSDLIDQGDSVVHAKYGHGVVEKMIKYGTKTLYSINFDNIGRRLLDPTLTEIKKA